MKSLFYLLVMELKNSLLELKKKPAKLIMYILAVLLVVFMAVISLTQEQAARDSTSLFWFKGIFFAYITLFVVTSVLNALSSGASFFDMSDVNLLFVSPVNSGSILLYGIAKLTKMAFVAGFFILFQSSNLKSLFGIGYGGIWLILFVYMFCIICLTIISVIIYNATNGREKRKLAVKLLTLLIYIPVLLFFLLRYIGTGNFSGAIESAINSPFFKWIPVAGWGAEGITAIMSGDIIYGAVFLGLIVLTSIIMVIYIFVSKTDYYEDVLCATETAFERKRAAMEGNVNVVSTNRKIKVDKTGVGGRGCSAILSKHMRESFRENRFGFLGLSTVLYIACAAAVSWFMRDTINIIIIGAFLMYIQVIKIGTGHGLKELYSHYIYLIPEPPFAKIVWSNMEIIVKSLSEGILTFGIAGLILRENILIVVCTIVVYTLFSMFLVGMNYCSLRFTGADTSAVMILMLYMFAIIIAMLPGIIPALIVGFLIGGSSGTVFGLLIVTLWEIIAAAVCFYFSKGILHNCDMPAYRMVK